ncbi:MAG: alpha/beta hydrolase [Erysipelotrichaceae bacterium]|nr:alpha/beta hydrolase [Erysipelotrichaceae bacterium]
MSFIQIDQIDLHYEEYGDAGRSVLLLHGWGQNTEMMAFIGEFLKSHFHVYNLDLPGFGQSGEPDRAWGSEEYCDFVKHFSDTMGIEDPIIIGHSFGCRIAIQYAYRYKVHKMVLTGAAGVRDKRGVDYYLKVYSYKLGKKILSMKPFEKYKEQLTKNAGSEDYRNSSGVMRQTFVKIVNEDLTPLLKDVKAETLLVFGENDDATPVEKGKLMEKLMPDAALVIFENDDHYAYFHQANRFCLVLDAFLRSDYQ